MALQGMPWHCPDRAASHVGGQGPGGQLRPGPRGRELAHADGLLSQLRGDGRREPPVKGHLVAPRVRPASGPREGPGGGRLVTGRAQLTGRRDTTGWRAGSADLQRAGFSRPNGATGSADRRAADSGREEVAEADHATDGAAFHYREVAE